MSITQSSNDCGHGVTRGEISAALRQQSRARLAASMIDQPNVASPAVAGGDVAITEEMAAEMTSVRRVSPAGRLRSA
jgi:hypothetical protein